MIPLIDKHEFRKLLQIRDAMIDAGVPNVGNVFVPIGPSPEDREAVPFRILYLGRALQGEHREPDRDDYDAAVSWSKDVVQDKLINAGQSPFWSFIREIVRQSLIELGDTSSSTDMRNALDKIIAWSNLTKISSGGGNPQGKMLTMQADVCTELLKAEIKRVQPDLIIAAVGCYAEKEIADPLFGNEGWVHDTPKNDQNGIKRDHSSGIPIVFTPHPQNMLGTGNLEKSRAFCINEIVKARHQLRAGK
jgi:hypothetical protein